MRGYLKEYVLIKKAKHWWQDNEYKLKLTPIIIIGVTDRIKGETYKYVEGKNYVIQNGKEIIEIPDIEGNIVREEK
jgi:hypothetical protein